MKLWATASDLDLRNSFTKSVTFDNQLTGSADLTLTLSDTIACREGAEGKKSQYMSRFGQSRIGNRTVVGRMNQLEGCDVKIEKDLEDEYQREEEKQIEIQAARQVQMEAAAGEPGLSGYSVSINIPRWEQAVPSSLHQVKLHKGRLSRTPRNTYLALSGWKHARDAYQAKPHQGRLSGLIMLNQA